MLLLCCTQKLLKELKQEPANVVPLKSLLGSWHANLLMIERHKCVLATNDATLYSIFIPFRKRADFDAFHLIFQENLSENLLHEGFTREQVDPILNECKDIKYAKTNNLSVLGSMNDMKSQLAFRVHLTGGIKGTNSLQLNHELNRTIFGAIQYKQPIELLRVKISGS